MQLTAEKAAYIEEKLKQFKLVDMRQQYSDIIREDRKQFHGLS